MRMGEEGSFCLSPPPPFRCVLPLPPLRPKVWGARKIDTTLVLICISTVTTRDGTAEKEGSPSASAYGRIEKHVLSNDTRSAGRPAGKGSGVCAAALQRWMDCISHSGNAFTSHIARSRLSSRLGAKRRGSRQNWHRALAERQKGERERKRGKGTYMEVAIADSARFSFCSMPSPLDSILSILCNGPDCRMSDRK